MVQRFFRDSAIYFVPSILTTGMSFVMFPFYAHHFTPSEYGAFDLLTLTAMLVGWTVALEIYQGVGVYVSGERDQRRVRSYASTALWFAVATYTAFAIAAEALATPISHVLLGADMHVSLFRVAVPWMCVTGVLAIAQAQLRWQLRPVAFAIAAIINAVVTIVASAVLVFGAHLEVKGAILGQLMGASLSLSYALMVARGTFGLEFNRSRCREMLRFSVPLVPSSVGVFLNLYADRLVIQHLRSLADVGLYGVGYRLAMVVSLLLTGFQGAALPLILSRKHEPSTPEDLARIFRIFVALALSAFVVLTILAAPALRILAAPRYYSAASVVPLLIISVAFANMYIFAPGFAIAKKASSMAVISVAAGLANLALALILVPPLGIDGAGLATAITSVAWFAALMAISQRHYAVAHRWRPLIVASVVVFAFVGASIAVLPSSYATVLSPQSLVLRFGLILIGVLVALRLSLRADERQAVRRETSRQLRGWRGRRPAGAS